MQSPCRLGRDRPARTCPWFIWEFAQRVAMAASGGREAGGDARVSRGGPVRYGRADLHGGPRLGRALFVGSLTCPSALSSEEEIMTATHPSHTPSSSTLQSSARRHGSSRSPLRNCRPSKRGVLYHTRRRCSCKLLSADALEPLRRPPPSRPSACQHRSVCAIGRRTRRRRNSRALSSRRDGRGGSHGHCLTTYERLPPTTEVQLGGASSSSSSQNAVTANAAAAAPAPADDSGPPLLGELVGRGEQCYAPRCVCLLSLAHFPLAFKASLLALHTMAQASGAPLALPVEACLTHLALNVPRPVPGGPTVRFALGNGAAPLHVDCAPPTQLPSTDYSVCELLGRLQPHGLVSLFHACMLEQQIVVVCDDDELRLAVCELALALLHPLEWAHVYVPTIPDDLLQLLSNRSRASSGCVESRRVTCRSRFRARWPCCMSPAARRRRSAARHAARRSAVAAAPRGERAALLADRRRASGSEWSRSGRDGC